MTDFARTLVLVCAVALAASPPGALSAQTPLGSPIPDQPLGQVVAGDGGESHESFIAHQLRFSRVASARQATDRRLRAKFTEKGLEYPAREIFIRVFKHERELELWARSDPEAAFDLVVRYPVCALPGQLGPKQRMGDVQVPEGFYFIDEFNPRSNYHLSLRVNYPNLADRMRRRALALGGDIYIHGGCETVGCVPIEDHNIAELYWIAAQASDAGQAIIPVHIFPARLDPDRLKWLETTFRPEAELLEFWRNLAQGYAFFEQTRRVPWVTVAEDGRYVVPEPPRVAVRDGAEGEGEQGEAEQTPAEQTPAEQTPAEQTPGERTPGEQGPGEQGPGERGQGEQGQGEQGQGDQGQGEQGQGEQGEASADPAGEAADTRPEDRR